MAKLPEWYARAGDAKVSPLMTVKTEPQPRKRGTGWKYETTVKVRNSIGTLPARFNDDGTVTDNGCTDATPFCGTCYAATLAAFRPAVANTLTRNLDLEQNLTQDEITYAYLLAFRAFQAECNKHNLPAEDRVWRDRWSGDHTPTTAGALVDAVAQYPQIHVWVYTRVPMAALILATSPQITIYASVDEWNTDTWAPILAADSRILVAACAETIADAHKVREKLGRVDTVRGIACPENTGRLPITVPLKGKPVRGKVEKGEKVRGACVACRHCVDGKGDVAFATRGK